MITLSLLLALTASAQDLVNGNFETNTANGCFYGGPLTGGNAGFNALITGVTAFGTFNEPDLHTFNCFVNPIEGDWCAGIGSDSSSGRTDAISMALTSPLVVGRDYTLTFQSHDNPESFAPGEGDLIVGVSTQSTSFGTQIGTVDPTDGTWQLHTLTFTATEASTRITFEALTGLGITWVQIDDVQLSSTCDDDDGDGVCNADDICTGDDATGDTDSDGVCDDIDACDGDDATGDTDGDGVCDDLDLCDGDDVFGDTDNDGVCEDIDLCIGDDSLGDADANGICDLPPTLSITGTCPGFLDIELSGATPNSNLIFATSDTAGSFVIPAGPCAGTQTEFGGAPSVRGTFFANSVGEITLSIQVTNTATCGDTLQVLDPATCFLYPAVVIGN